MKKILIVLCTMFSGIIFSQTYYGNLVLTSQSEINDFGSQGYSHITGQLRIEEETLGGITNLNALTDLQTMGDLNIINNSSIQDLSGLDNVTSISNMLQIYNNDSLIDASGLNNLQSVGGLSISYNELISSLNGLENLNFCRGLVEMTSNPSLENFDSLSNLNILNGQIYIYNNVSLNSVNGFKNLSEVGGRLVINLNPSLQNLNGLQNIRSVNGDLYIIANSSLNNLCSIYGLLFNNGIQGTYNVSDNDNGYTPTEEDILNNCTNDYIDLEILYPRLEDVYNSGTNIRIQLAIPDELADQTPIQVYYSTNNGFNWISSDILLFDLNSGGVNWLAPNVSEPTNFKIKIEVGSNSLLFNRVSEAFTIQPANYYLDQGFNLDGISNLYFPFEGVLGLDFTYGWYGLVETAYHNCIDENAQDWNYVLGGDEQECGKDFYSPIYGKVIYIDSSDDTDVCGSGVQENAGNQIVIQSLVDNTFVVKVAHLSEIRNDLIEDSDSIVEAGDLIGKVGGTGTAFSHAHISLYKNVYGWASYETGESSILELLSEGASVFSQNNQSSCDNLANRFSAEFDLGGLYFNNVSEVLEIVTSQSILQALAVNQFTSLIYSLIIDPNHTSRYNNSSTILSLDGLETIRSIDGDLIIRNTEVQNLDGLSNLTHVGGDLIIEDNTLLNDYCGLFKLIENNGIEGNVIIQGNLINPEESSILSCGNTLNISDSLSADEVILFPNPTTGKINFSLSQSVSFLESRVYSIQGKMILVSENNSIDLSKYPNGIYIIKMIINNKGSRVFKVVKK